MVIALQAALFFVLIASFILSMLANARMIDYCRFRRIRLRYAIWEYWVMPGLISNEYAQATREHEMGETGIWYLVFWSASIGTLLLSLCFYAVSGL